MAITTKITDVMGTGLVAPTATVMPSAPKTTTPTVAPRPVTPLPTSPTAPQVNLNANQQTLLKKNNPELYNKLYGTGPVEVNVGDVGTSPVNAPTSPTSTVGQGGALGGAIASAETSLAQQGQEQFVSGNRSEMDMTKDLMAQLFMEGQTFDPSQVKADVGYYTAKEEVDAINNRIIAQQKANRDEINRLRENPEGKLVGALQAEIQNKIYEQDNNLADLAIQQMAAQGKYENAYEIASDRIKAEEQRYDRQMNFYRDWYTMLQDDMTESEQMMFQSQLSMMEYGQKNLIDSKTEALRAAGANGAPVDILTSIKNAQTADEVWQVAGGYGVDPNLALARDKFRFDRELALERLAIERAQAAGDVSVATASKLEAQAQTNAMLGKAQQSITDILGNTTGFGVATGKSRGALLASLKYGVGTGVLGGAAGSVVPVVGTTAGAVAGFLGGTVGGYTTLKTAQEDLAVNMDYITSNLTTQALADAKARGVTFGALSEREMEVIGGSADKLSRAWDSEKMQFRGRPETIEQALRELYSTFEGKKITTQLGVSKENQINQVWNQL